MGEEYLRRLILEETLKYNEEQLWRFAESGVFNEFTYKMDIFVFGYIRQCIEPLLDVLIPLDIAYLLYAISPLE